MILPFSTKLNGKPTYFVEKILRTFLNEYAGKVEGIADFIYHSGQVLSYDNVDDMFHKIEHQVKPKLHTIRQDKKDRWEPGTMIDFFINTRTKDMFRFAPRLPVVDVQEVFMTYYCNDIIEISVDGNYINNVTEFAINDGFDTWNDFFNYFYPIIEANKDKCFKGKIIHWTDKRY